MSDTSTITIGATARGLHALLDPVLPFADKGDSRPSLATVRLCGKGKWVTATTTWTAAASPCSAARSQRRTGGAAPRSTSATSRPSSPPSRPREANDPRWSCP